LLWVRYKSRYDEEDLGGLTFVPDPAHEWDGGSLS